MQNTEPGIDDNRPRGRLFQFSLGSLLLATTVVCLWLGTQVNAARRQGEIAIAVGRLGGVVHYDWQLDADDQPALPFRGAGRTKLESYSTALST